MLLLNIENMILGTLSIVVCMILTVQSNLVNSREINEIPTNLPKKDLESCYHAERLLRSGISPDLVIRTLEATGQVSEEFLDKISSKTYDLLERSSPQAAGKASSSQNRRKIGSIKQATTAGTTPLLDIPNITPLVYPESYTVIPDVKLINKYKNKDRSVINAITDIVTTNSNLLQAYPINIALSGNKYRGSDVEMNIQDMEMNLASGLRSNKSPKEEKNKISQRMVPTSQAAGFCDEFVVRGIRENLGSQQLARNTAKTGSPASVKKFGINNDREGDVIIKTKALNGKDSNIRSIKDLVLGIAALDESFNIFDVMTDDHFTDSKSTSNEFFMVSTATINT
ncbi:uncharacterized protein LOC141858553 [Brevipalpus obovatus]|uniref:uncharacterized protein LOC141858553 n=1 Tax=Brevipalpus obovatus TaxID=246614 RepID=UPI003D9E3C01